MVICQEVSNIMRHFNEDINGQTACELALELVQCKLSSLNHIYSLTAQTIDWIFYRTIVWSAIGERTRFLRHCNS